jgi:glycosyltransferase involved in cell wall biosynthesis
MGTLQERISVSAVVPTLNAAETLAEALTVLRRSAMVGEVIVADGGSSD